MALSIGTSIANLTTYWNAACTDWDSHAAYLQGAGAALLAGNLIAAGNNLNDAGVSFQLGLGHFWAYTGDTVHRYLLDCLNKINDDWPSGSTVTMDAILSAMLTAKFDQLQKFIGIEQAYMATVWNAPFNVDFYAALARGFRLWP